MARKKLFAIDPPMKNITIRVPSVIANEFNELLLDEIDRIEAEKLSKGTKPPINIKLSKAELKTNVFTKMVLDKSVSRQPKLDKLA